MLLRKVELFLTYSLRSVAKGSFLYASGQVLTKASAFLLIPLYTRFLTPDDYGVVGYMQFLLQILSTILMFGFYGAQTRFFYQHKNEPTTIGEYLFSINVWLAVVLVPGVVMVLFWGESLYGWIGPKDIPYHPFVPLIAWTILFQIVNQLVISFGVARKEYFRTTLLQLLLFALTTGFALFLVVVQELGAEGKIRAMLYGQAAFFLMAYPTYAKNFIYRIKWRYISFSLSFGVPIVIHLLSGVMHSSIDRAILAEMVPVSELGLYTLGYQVGLVMSIMTTSVNRAWQPSYYELMESDNIKKDHHIRRTFNLWMILMALMCTLGILWGGDVLQWITPSRFHGATRVIPFVLLGYFFHGLYFFAVSPIFFFKKTVLLPWFTGAAAGVNIGLNFILIPYWGITGAALATTISMLFQAVVVYVAGKRFHDHGFSLKGVVAVSLVMVLGFVSLLPLENPWESHGLRVFCFIVLLAVMGHYYKGSMKEIKNKLLPRFLSHVH